MFVLASGEPGAGADPFDFVFKHALDHKGWLGGPFTTFQSMMLLVTGALILAGFVANTTSLVPRGFFRNAFESLLLFVRNDVVRPAMGTHHGDHFVPFFCTLFVTIFMMNLIGLIPGCGTATSNLYVTGALAGIVLLVSLVSGIVIHKGHFFHLFVPGGVPKMAVPLLFVLEFLGFFVKHAVLMIRLFANMLAGHLVIGAFIGMVWVFKSYLVGAFLTVPLALFVSFLELLVAFLQAYVFTMLSALFIGGMVHPEH